MTNENSNTSSLVDPKTSMKLTLVLDYRTPTLNLTKRQHWTAQYREKKKAWAALRAALSSAESDPSTPIMLQDRLRTASMVFAAADLFPVTIPPKSSSSLGKSEFHTLMRNAQKSL
jgi:hypothetical protein